MINQFKTLLSTLAIVLGFSVAGGFLAEERELQFVGVVIALLTIYLGEILTTLYFNPTHLADYWNTFLSEARYTFPGIILFPFSIIYMLSVLHGEEGDISSLIILNILFFALLASIIHAIRVDEGNIFENTEFLKITENIGSFLFVGILPIFIAYQGVDFEYIEPEKVGVLLALILFLSRTAYSIVSSKEEVMKERIGKYLVFTTTVAVILFAI